LRSYSAQLLSFEKLPGGYPSTRARRLSRRPSRPPPLPLLRALAFLCLRRRAARVQISHRAICWVLEYPAPGTRVPGPGYSSTRGRGTRVPRAWSFFAGSRPRDARALGVARPGGACAARRSSSRSSTATQARHLLPPSGSRVVSCVSNEACFTRRPRCRLVERPLLPLLPPLVYGRFASLALR
jgi:hypothetical protein